MEAYRLRIDQIRNSLEKPEAGMGYQSAKLEQQEGYIVASKVFVPISISARGQVAEPQYYTKALAVKAPEPKGEVQAKLNIDTDFGRYSVFGLKAKFQGTSISAASELPDNEAITDEEDVFFRVSAYPDDQRIIEGHRLAPGSYATTKTDLTVVPSGLAAVGRFALPTRISARHLYQIKPGRGVKIFYGTVIPKYGLCGGGVEVFFPDGTGPGTVSAAEKLPEK
jgi:hypothetical protein